VLYCKQLRFTAAVVPCCSSCASLQLCSPSTHTHTSSLPLSPYCCAHRASAPPLLYFCCSPAHCHCSVPCFGDPVCVCACVCVRVCVRVRVCVCAPLLKGGCVHMYVYMRKCTCAQTPLTLILTRTCRHAHTFCTHKLQALPLYNDLSLLCSSRVHKKSPNAIIYNSQTLNRENPAIDKNLYCELNELAILLQALYRTYI